MKRSLCYTTLLAGTVFSLSCQKMNSANGDEVADKKKPKKDLCLINSFSYSNSYIPTQTIFTNHFDLSGRALEVDAGLFSGGSILSSISLNVTWTTNGIAFFDANDAQDTILVATFDRKGRVDQIIPGNKPNYQFLPTTFTYSKNQLQSMNVTVAGNIETSNFNYDNKGNLVSITDLPTTSVPVPGKVEYGYATNEKATDQFYFDEPRKFSWNSFSLLQYIGLFPELQPTNLRTSTNVTWGNNYQVYQMNIGNHQLDNLGKLVSYDVISPTSGQTISHYNINWSCDNSTFVQTQGNN
jgi:hypothetical protein